MDLEHFLSTIPRTITSCWELSKFSDWNKQANKPKGFTGERYVQEYLEELGLRITKAPDQAHYDLFDETNQCKIEVKTSFSTHKRKDPEKRISADEFLWQHIALEKGYDILAVLGINHELDECVYHKRGWRPAEEREEIVLAFFTREELKQAMEAGYFTRQIGGSTHTNADWAAKTTWFKDADYFKDNRIYPHLKNIS